MEQVKIVIASFKRAKILYETTLELLLRLNVDIIKDVEIVVETEEMKKEYLETIPFKLKIIVSNTDGLKGKRNFIRNYYQYETDYEYILSMDDDIKDILNIEGKSITENEWIKLVETGFEECEKNGAYIWSLTPSDNSFFYKDSISYNLKTMIGAFQGIIIDRDMEPIQTEFNQYEDLDFSIQHFLRDKKVVKLNMCGLKTKYFNPKGGLGEWYGGNDKRKEAQDKDAEKLINKYPAGICKKVVKKKWGYDVVLNYRFKIS